MKTFLMTESLYDEIFRSVTDYENVMKYIELAYGLKDTGHYIRNTDTQSPGFWTDEDQYVFEVVDEPKYIIFLLRWT